MKFLVADDHELFLTGLEMVIASRYPRAKIVIAHNYTEIYEIIEEQDDFDAVLTDLAMPGDVWSNAIQKIHNKLPDTPIVILSAIFEEGIVHKTIETGVSGYIHKTASHKDILEALDVVISGGAYLPEELVLSQSSGNIETELLLEGVATEINNSNKHLTPRQKAVLEAIASGKANKQIAYDLGLTEGTVKLHVTAILKILGVNNRTAAVIEATKLGLIKK